MAMKYILIDIDESQSRLNSVTMWRLSFYCVDDGTFHEMTVDSSYTNFKKSGWNHVVHHPCPWGVYLDLKRTDRKTRQKTPVVSADSRVNISMQCEDLAEAQALVELDIAQRGQTSQFHELFSNE
jgi:hypothetical protein